MSLFLCGLGLTSDRAPGGHHRTVEWSSLLLEATCRVFSAERSLDRYLDRYKLGHQSTLRPREPRRHTDELQNPEDCRIRASTARLSPQRSQSTGQPPSAGNDLLPTSRETNEYTERS